MNIAGFGRGLAVAVALAAGFGAPAAFAQGPLRDLVPNLQIPEPGSILGREPVIINNICAEVPELCNGQRDICELIPELCPGAVAPPPAEAVADEVASVELIVVGGDRPSLVIVARGSSDDVANPVLFLRPVQYFAPPADGIYDFTLMARPGDPAVSVAIYRWESVPGAVAGVRVRAASGAVDALLDEPLGSPDTAMDPADLVGKRLVRTGETYTGDLPSIAEADIGHPAHILGPDDPAPAIVNPGDWLIVVDARSVIVSVGSV